MEGSPIWVLFIYVSALQYLGMSTTATAGEEFTITKKKHGPEKSAVMATKGRTVTYVSLYTH